ncbi:hypothetical protein MMC11_005138 [Xylographa trunciseda]|nr:hypothetical protein [Xylographa trunciseda]
MTPELEILVHISAPSRVIDDGKYRKQALGLLDFEATTRLDIGPCNDVPEQLVPVTPYLQGARSHASLAQPPRDKGIQDASRDALVESTFYDEVSWDSSVAARRDHQPPLPTTMYTTPRVVVNRTPALDRPQSAPVPASPSFQGTAHRRSQSDSWQTPPSVIPDSQPEPSQLKRSFPEPVSFSSSAGLSSPSAKRQRLDLVDEARLEHAPSSTESAEDIPVIGTRPTAPSSPPWTTSSGLSATSHRDGRVEVHPPPPKTSLASFTTHITPSLALIEEKLPMARFFNPVFMVRDPQTLERGYWQLLFDSKVLSHEREKFWEFLVQFISEGRAGWGVWAEKFQTERSMMNGEAAPEGQTQVAENEIVRVYCWGEVVGYIYILLFMGSHRKIKQMGARWVDAGGEVVIRMDE